LPQLDDSIISTNGEKLDGNCNENYTMGQLSATFVLSNRHYISDYTQQASEAAIVSGRRRVKSLFLSWSRNARIAD